MDSRALVHFGFPKDGGDLHERLGIVIGVEDGELSRQDREQDDSRRPDVNRYTVKRKKNKKKKEKEKQIFFNVSNHQRIGLDVHACNLSQEEDRQKKKSS